MYKKISRVLCLAAIGFLPIVAVAQTPEDDREIAQELSINNSRPVLLRELASKIMPDCDLQISDRELGEFFAYWRDMANQMQIYNKQHNIPDRDSPPPAGIKLMPQMPLAEVAKVDAGTPGAANWARDEIETWHIYSCVSRQFGANQFFAHYGFYGAPWPAALTAKLVTQPDNSQAMMIPDMSSLEPLDALGRFFRKAQSQGLMGFTDLTHEHYFFYRYESSYFANMKRSDATDRWFDAPPWQPSGP